MTSQKLSPPIIPQTQVSFQDLSDASAGGQASPSADTDASRPCRSDASPSGPGDASVSGGAGVDASSARRLCAWCPQLIPGDKRRDSQFCSKRCRQASHRFRVDRAASVATDRPMRFAYADPPYPGCSHYYPERREVDHALLLEQLTDSYPDGWALSTSADALPAVLSLCPSDVRVCAWRRGARGGPAKRPRSSWEPLLVAGGRALAADVAHDVEDSLVYEGRYRAFPGAIVGMKPPQFAVWMFGQLGAGRGDILDDLFPGSGAIAEAWRRYAVPPLTRAPA